MYSSLMKYKIELLFEIKSTAMIFVSFLRTPYSVRDGYDKAPCNEYGNMKKNLR